jgi:hypothetical protein
MYDYAITFEGEIAFMWQRITPVSMLFAANRYGAIIYGVLAIASGYATSGEVSIASSA